LFSISLVQYNFIFFLLFSLSFIFKAPLFPFFNWLIFLHIYASTGISVFLASFYLKMWALFFLYFYFYLNYNLILYFGILTCFLVLLFISFEINFKRIIAFGSIFHCAISLMFIYFWYVIQFQSLILYFFIIHFIHAFCSGLFFYYFGILYEFCLIKTWVAFTTFSKFWNEFIFFAFLLSMVYFSFPLFFTFLVETVILTNIQSTFYLYLYFLLILTNFIFLFLNFKFFYNSYSNMFLSYLLQFKYFVTLVLITMSSFFLISVF